ncbi:MAG: hypothetical protein AB8I08_08740 [Sandaracinaceae bacterium]
MGARMGGLSGWSRQTRLGVVVLALLGGLIGLVPSVTLHLMGLSPTLAMIYLGASFISSASVVFLAYRAGADSQGKAPYTLTMLGLGTLNGGFSAVLQGGLSGESDFVLVMGLVGAFVGGVIAVVYAIGFWPGMRLVQEVTAHPTRHDGTWMRQVVGLTWTVAGLLLMAAIRALTAIPDVDETPPLLLPLGVLIFGVMVVSVAVVERLRLTRIAAGTHPGFSRVTAESLGADAEGLPRLHPGVSHEATHIVLRLASNDEEGPYRAGTTGEPYARVD